MDETLNPSYRNQNLKSKSPPHIIECNLEKSATDDLGGWLINESLVVF